MRHEPLAALCVAQALGLAPQDTLAENPRADERGVPTAAQACQPPIEPDMALADPTPQLSKTPLDSPGGLKAVALAVQTHDLPPTAEVVAFFSESWMHPRLREWGKEHGFLDSTDPNVALDSRIGHFDHAPYALNSTFGRNAVPTPFQTTTTGRIYLVEYDRRNKALVIATQVRDTVRVWDSLPGSKSPHSPFPPRFPSPWTIGFELQHHINALREGLGVCPQLGNSEEYGNRLIEGAKAGLAMAISSEYKERINLSDYDQSIKNAVLAALVRLEDLAPVLQETQEAWAEEALRRQSWREDLHARLVAREAADRAAAEAPDGDLFI